MNLVPLEKKKEIVLVLGSKPNAIIPFSNFTYCANASASYYEKKLQNHKNIISIVSASEVVLGTRKNSPQKDKWINDRKKKIAHSISDQIIMYGVDIFSESIEILQNLNCSTPIKSMTMKEIFLMIKNITGVNVPTLAYDHIFNNYQIILNISKFIKNFIRINIYNDYDVDGLFRPSTGIIALIYAVLKHGKNATYIVSGISITDRGIYPDGEVNTWSGAKSLNTKHVYADKKILILLSKNYDIKTTESSLKMILKKYNQNM